MIIINQDSGLIKYTTLGIVILYSIIVTFSESYIEIINSDKGLFRKSMRLFFITFGKTKNINDYRYGIIKIVNQVYASPKGAEPWRNRDSEFKIQVAKIWFIKKNEADKELIFRGKKEEMNKFINEFINMSDLPLYKGHFKKGLEINRNS